MSYLWNAVRYFRILWTGLESASADSRRTPWATSVGRWLKILERRPAPPPHRGLGRSVLASSLRYVYIVLFFQSSWAYKLFNFPPCLFSYFEMFYQKRDTVAAVSLSKIPKQKFRALFARGCFPLYWLPCHDMLYKKLEYKSGSTFLYWGRTNQPYTVCVKG